jgi:hypothetical protein
MGTSCRRGSLAAVLAVAGMLLCQPREAQAHPLFVGRWIAPVPPGGVMVYDFYPPVYITNWIWKGEFTFYVSNCPVTSGTYILRMYTGTEGTLELRDGTMLSTSVGTVDLGTRVMVFKNVTFRP